MKKQDNESLIQELTKRLDWYIMKASDEEFDADEVQTLMKLLDNLKTEEDNVEDELPVEEALDDFWKHCEEREEEERLLLGTEEEKDKSEPVAEKEEDKPREGKIEKYYDIEKIPEEYKEYVEEVGEIERVSAYEIDNIKVMKSMYNDTVYVYMNNVNDALRFEIRIYPQEIQRVRETYPGYTFEKEFEDGGINFDIFSKEESSGEYTYIMYFYYGKEKYIVIGRNDEERIRDIVIAYKNVILSHEGNQQ